MLDKDKILSSLQLVDWDSVESNCQVPTDVIELLKNSGAFEILSPKSDHKPALDPLEVHCFLVELAKIDASIAWLVMIGADSGFYKGHLGSSNFLELSSKKLNVTAGWLAPKGEALQVDGGYLIQGNWAFGSGIDNADVITMGCRVVGTNEHIIALCSSEKIVIKKVWNTLGLRGTGSNEYSVTKLFVPERHVVRVNELAKGRGGFYSTLDSLLIKMLSIPIGLAEKCLDYTLGSIYESNRSIADDVKLSQLSEAIVKLTSAKCLAEKCINEFMMEISKDTSISSEKKAYISLYRYYVFQECRKTIQILFDISDNSIFKQKSPLEKSIRDINTMCQHAVSHEKIKVIAARSIVGMGNEFVI